MRTIFLSLLVTLLGSVLICRAELRYISKENSITFRSGPGTKHKVLKMVYSGQAVKILEESEAWTKIQLRDGQEGWVMSRFLTADIPESIASDTLKKEYEQIKNDFAALQEISKNLKAEHEQNLSQLKLAKQGFVEKRNAYNQLKKELKAYISIKSDYSKIAADIAAQRKRVEDLKSQKIKEGLVAGLIVLSVLLLGYIMGSIYRHNRRESSLY